MRNVFVFLKLSMLSSKNVDKSYFFSIILDFLAIFEFLDSLRIQGLPISEDSEILDLNFIKSFETRNIPFESES